MKRTIGFVITALLLGLTVWGVAVLDRSDRDKTALPGAQSDYLLEDFRMVAMDQAGLPSFQIEAPFLEKNPTDDSVAIREPELTLFLDGIVTWQIDAPEAWIDATGERIELPGAVLLVSERAPRTQVQTSEVTVFPRRQQAISEAAVRVTRDNMFSRGIGFKADLSSQQFDILSQVEGYYEPPS